MDTCFAVPFRVSYPGRWRRAMQGRRRPEGDIPRIYPNLDIRGAGGVIVTPVSGRSGQGGILDLRVRCAGLGTNGTRGMSNEIRCAPDLNLSPKERADG